MKEKNSFFILPKEIMRKKISDGGKLLYAMMLDRMNLSVSNGWEDEEGRVYIYFGINEIKETMFCGKDKAIRMVAELENEGLIERKKQGQGRASIIYVKQAPKTEFRKSEKKNSKGRKVRVLEVEKCDTNNTYNNNTDKSYTENTSYLITADSDRWMEKRKIIMERIKKNISYEACKERYGEGWCDEIVEIMVDTLTSEKPYIKINGQNYPFEAVKSRFLKINDMHIGYINDALAENKSRIRNIRNFLITTIYRAPETTENWYSARVNYDMAGGG